MDMNRLTQKSQEALHDAQTKALRFGHVEVDGEHLLLALLDQGEGLVAPLLARAGADPGAERDRDRHIDEHRERGKFKCRRESIEYLRHRVLAGLH